MLLSFLKGGKVLTNEHLSNASWRSGFVITSDESDTLPLYSVKLVYILLEIWVPNDSVVFNIRSHQRDEHSTDML